MLLLAVPAFFLWKLRTGLLGALATGAVRMVVQLALIGVYLRYLFEWNMAVVNILWVVIMTLVAAHTSVARTGLEKRLLLWPTIVAFLCSALVVGLYFIVPVLGVEHPFEARYFIPIMGILLGNMLGVNVVALSTYYGQLRREQQMYYYLLGNGATRFEATMPFLRAGVVKAFQPCIANMAVLGLVSLPGTMIGQILGGSAPGVAVRYQMMITVITLSATMLSLMTTVWLSDRRAFDEKGRLIIREKGK